jgi:hypothetical protein
MLFDYGDEWRFNFKLEEVSPPQGRTSKPRLVARGGELPQQYPSWEEDEDEEEE